ncbi:MAG: hypothetical protein HGA67_03920 [Candidatus Yonathbacteria bacterium]|nr:hypothetical protein [Candidatus Yonathbacteria bacterium]
MTQHAPTTCIKPSYLTEKIMEFIRTMGGETNEITITILAIVTFLADFHDDEWGVFDLARITTSLEETAEATRDKESENSNIPLRNPAFTTLDVRASINEIVGHGYLEPVTSFTPGEELYRATDKFPKWCLSELARLSGCFFLGNSALPLS